MNHLLCPLCDQPAETKYSQHIGYQCSSTFAIQHCSQCNTAFAHPRKIDHELYNLIYSKVSEVPGYDRYLKYADQVLLQEHPLDYLANSEDIYWGVREYFRTKRRKSAKILEVGSGFGYLTYALQKEGYEITGLDISCVAVEQAKARYGNHFVCGDILELAKSQEGIYDVVILTEVIEHIPDPIPFLKAIYRLLTAKGDLVLTTPSKTLFPADVLWETEPPPIHLWWFSEKSLLLIGKKLGFSLSFIDFAEFNQMECKRIAHLQSPPVIRGYQPSRQPRLDENGNVIPVPPALEKSVEELKADQIPAKKTLTTVIRKCIKSFLQKLGLFQTVRRIVFPDKTRRNTLCAILTKK